MTETDVSNRRRTFRALLKISLILGVPAGFFTKDIPGAYGFWGQTLIATAIVFIGFGLCSLMPGRLYRCSQCGGNEFWCDCEK